MPTYEYECQACGHAWELFQSMSEDPVKSCPSCKKRKAQRLIGGGGAILFKGSGFYVTDYRSDAYAKAAKAESGAATPAAAPAAESPKAKSSE